MGLATFIGKGNFKIQREKWVKHHLQWGYLVLRKVRFLCSTRSTSGYSKYNGWFDDGCCDCDDWSCRRQSSTWWSIVAVLGAVDNVFMFCGCNCRLYCDSCCSKCIEKDVSKLENKKMNK